MKKASVTLIFDFPVSINEYSIFDVGSSSDYIDWTSTKIQFQQEYKANIKAVISELVNHTKESNTAISAYFSSVFIQLLSEVDPKTVGRLRDGARGSLEVLGGPYCHSLASVNSLDRFAEEVKLHQKVMKDAFDIKPDRFFNTENIYFNALSSALKKLGYRSAFAGAIDWYLANDKGNRVFHADQIKNFHVLLVDRDKGDAFFNDHEQASHFLQFDLEMLKQFAGLKSVIRIIKNKAEILSLDDHIKSFKSIGAYKIKSPIMGSIKGKSLEDYLGKGMQLSVFNLYYDLEWKSLRKKDIKIEDYLSIGQLSTFSQLATNYNNGLITPYEKYSRLINILSDFKIKAG